MLLKAPHRLVGNVRHVHERLFTQVELDRIQHQREGFRCAGTSSRLTLIQGALLQNERGSDPVCPISPAQLSVEGMINLRLKPLPRQISQLTADVCRGDNARAESTGGHERAT